MRIAVLALLLAVTSAYAQNPAACGPAGVNFKVSFEEPPHAIAPPDPQKATVYVIQESGFPGNVRLYPTTRIGVDGAWVGANNKNSYFSFTLAPGEHHLCVTIQSRQIPTRTELAHLTAEPGKIYYYRSRIIWANFGPQYLNLEPVDSDEAKYLIGTYALATAQVRK